MTILRKYAAAAKCVRRARAEHYWLEKAAALDWRKDKDWMDDPDAVQNYVNESVWIGPLGALEDVGTPITGKPTDAQLYDLVHRHNLYTRENKISDALAGHLDKLREQGLLTQDEHRYLLRTDSNVVKAYLSSRDLSGLDSESRARLKSLLSRRREKSPTYTRKDTGSAADATPRQRQAWQRVLDESTLGRVLRAGGENFARGAAWGGAFGALRGALDPEVGVLPGIISRGIGWGTIASIGGVANEYANARAEKRYARKRLGES